MRYFPLLLCLTSTLSASPALLRAAETPVQKATAANSASLHGRLFLADKKTPAAGYKIATRVMNRGDASIETVTKKDGTFQLDKLETGAHHLDVFTPGARQPFYTLNSAQATTGKSYDTGSWTVPQQGWQWLFNGRLQRGGRASAYGGQGEMKIDGDHLVLGTGQDLTGVTWTENLPRLNYEITLDALRAAGQDFFCGLTFPAGADAATFIVGGWSGRVVGISNIDWMSAVENETTKPKDFETGRWYRIRLRVTAAKLEAWIDLEKMVDLPLKGRQLSIRSTVEPSLPLGVATWQTTGWLRDVRLRQLDADEIAAIAGTLPPE
jgi:hypothetical protein